MKLKFFGFLMNLVFAVLVLLRGSQSIYHGMMNYLNLQCRYIKPLLLLGTGFLCFNILSVSECLSCRVVSGCFNYDF